MGNKKNIRRAIKRTYSMKQKHMMEVVNKKKRMASNPSADEPSEKTFHKLQKYSEHEIPGTSLSVATVVTPKADPNSSDNETITGDVLYVEPKTEPQEVYDCRDGWRKIRVSSMRSLKQQQTDKPPIRPYYLSEELNFLTPFIKINSKEESTNIQEINIHNEVQFEVASVNTVKYEMSETDSSDCFETENDETEEIDRNIFNNHTLPRIVNIQSVEEDIPKNSIKRHNDDLIENNPRKMFLLGILPDVESLTEHEMRRFRTEVIEVIDKIMNERDNSKN